MANSFVVGLNFAYCYQMRIEFQRFRRAFALRNTFNSLFLDLIISKTNSIINFDCFSYEKILVIFSTIQSKKFTLLIENFNVTSTVIIDRH